MESVPVQPVAERREFLTINGKQLETLLIQARDSTIAHNRHAA